MPCPGSHSWWAEGWKTQPGDLSAEPRLPAVCLADKASQAAPRVPPRGRRQGTRGAHAGSRRSSVGLLGQREAPDNSDDPIQRRRGLTPPQRHPRPAGCLGAWRGPEEGVGSGEQGVVTRMLRCEHTTKECKLYAGPAEPTGHPRGPAELPLGVHGSPRGPAVSVGPPRGPAARPVRVYRSPWTRALQSAH